MPDIDEDEPLQCKRIMDDFAGQPNALVLENVMLKTARGRFSKKEEEAQIEEQPYGKVVIDFRRNMLVGSKVFANDNVDCVIMPLLKVDKIEIQKERF